MSVIPDSETNWENALYLPHHPVTNVNKADNLRRVTNASSVYQGALLNSSRSKGPDFMCNLTGLNLRFRETCVALSADIGAMFVQNLQIDASYDIYGVPNFMNTIAIFSVRQIHRVLLATLFDSVLGTTKLSTLTLQS